MQANGAEGSMDRPLSRVLIISTGSRGDCQPYIAVALGLKEAGYEVMYGTSADHEELVKSHGINFHATWCSTSKVLRENASLVKSMNEGDAKTFLKGVAEVRKGYARLHLENFKALIEDFKPDLLISGTLCEFFAVLASTRLKIPVLTIALAGFGFICDPKRMIFGLPNLPFGLNAWLVKTIIISGLYDSWACMDKLMPEIFGFRVLDVIQKKAWIESIENPPTPRLITEGPIWQKVFFDHLQYGHNNRFVGTPVLPKEVQLDHVKADEGAFGSGSSLGKMKDFLARSGRPVYMGWGSLTCKTPEYMVRLVLAALKYSGLKAIIYAGWAGLSLDLLDRTKDAELFEYAEANALFVHEAPHEWLFPQCSCIVHHGGAGTTTAALRSKVPSIITPVFLDQFEHSYLLNQLGVGVGLGHFQKLSSKEIGDALVRCTTDTSMAMRAKEVGEAMLQERATERVVQEVKDFWRDWVQTGRYTAAQKRFIARCEGAAGGGCCKFF